MAQFDIGDYVLYADVWAHTRAKLSVKWCGPAQIVGTTSNWIFTVKNLVTGETREAHASRLKFYADDSLLVDEEFLRHVTHNSESHVVNEILDCRHNAKEKRFEFLVTWRGLDAAEDSWEPAATLKTDVPVVMRTYVKDHSKHPVVRRLAKALNLAITL